MGIFKKIGKGIKKVFKKIGKAIKKQFKRFGKFMNKIGIVGQIAMAFILPGIGNALMSSIGGAFTKMVGQTAAQAGASAAATKASALATAGGSTASQAAAAGAKAAATAKAAGTLGTATGMMASKSALVRGAGSVLLAASNFVGTGVKAFKTVTEGVSSFIGEFSKVALNKIPGVDIQSAAPTMGDAWKNVQNSVMKNTSDTIAAFNKTLGIDPVKGATEFGMAGFQVPERITVEGQMKKGIIPDLTQGAVKDSTSLLDDQLNQNTRSLTMEDFKSKPGQPSGALAQDSTSLLNQNTRSLTMEDYKPTTGKPSDILPEGTSPARKAAFDKRMEQSAGSADARAEVMRQRGQLVKTSGTGSQSLLEPRSTMDFKKFEAEFPEILKTPHFTDNVSITPIDNSIMYDVGGQKFYLPQAKLTTFDPSNIMQRYQVGEYKATGFLEQIGQNIKDIPTKVKTSILEAPQKIADVPGQFVDNLTSTVTGLPAAAAKAALNRAPDQTVNQYQFVASPIPENTYALNQAQMGSTDVSSISAYRNNAASGNVFGSPAFDSYDQYFKLVS